VSFSLFSFFSSFLLAGFLKKGKGFAWRPKEPLNKIPVFEKTGLSVFLKPSFPPKKIIFPFKAGFPALVSFLSLWPSLFLKKWRFLSEKSAKRQRGLQLLRFPYYPLQAP
jgi:hypothetical protein